MNQIITIIRPLIIFLIISLISMNCASTQNIDQTTSNPPENETNWEPADSPLMTRWAKDVSPGNVLPEYPRPQLVRATWKNLNGLWQYVQGGERQSPPFGEDLEQEILVPFAIESALSGVAERTDSLWYRHTFDVPEEWPDNHRVILHFGAVDWEATVFVNGEEVGSHRGGYDAFSFDITDYLNGSEDQELVVKVFDPTDDGNQPRGKQVKEPQGIWYTPVTGIWQTVWLEPVPEQYISGLKLTPDVDGEKLDICVEVEQGGTAQITAVAYDGDKEIAQATGTAGETFSLDIPEPELWSPDNPHLYDLEVQLESSNGVTDRIESYFGMRKIEIKEDEDGKAKIFLNNEFVFQLGPLDQGYWPDGLYTAPTDEALRYDLEITKRLGFNMNRKHVKIEPARWYYWADRLGVLIWQDMVTGSNSTPESREQFQVELEEMVAQFYNHPSIVNWVIFNEGWGQFDTKRITKRVKELDSSRLITDASGWQHHGVGDIIDVHRYPGPAAINPAKDRASVVGEFGGVGYVINNHTWGGDGWGYQDIIRKPEAYINRYEELTHNLRWLADKHGMSGGVYTQITDLETELNGMLTYDREIAKAAPQRFASVNKGLTPYIHPSDGKIFTEERVEIVNWAEGTEIRYTLDGSEPDTNATLYKGPFNLTEPATVRAYSFRNGVPVGYGHEVAFETVSGREPDYTTANELTNGLHYRYYESPSVNEPTYRRHWPLRRQIAGNNQVIDPVAAGTVEGFDISARGQEELFAFEFEGYIKIPENGMYTFFIAADDDAKMYIGGEQIFDRLGQSPVTAYDSARVALKEGLHKMELRYFQAYGPHELKVMIEGPGISKQEIPAEYLIVPE